ncbi:PHD and RING finger domain-containing protein [Quillaja saponaria]|uniref:PHD and RING finger domain-containing protein n=1 Tax=Quillaja saponaria TaxID=32244 RepID=A0AAD7LF07_QUISA|nr:PHD and RING finger domain-containing protein [Quillaja saponaria]
MAIDSDSSSTSPNKRLKTLVTNTTLIQTSKSKSQEQPESVDVIESVTCGICYSDDGLSIRGEIDSCTHYFCFICIMEWAKHESRCPICRQRFSTICRPPKDGVFHCARVVKIPVRDQVYHPNGNMTSTSVDPYAQVQCSVCHGMEDESFLLLCDLCDAAAHTYCVGLGHNVPEGDWFCNDCTLSRADHENCDLENQNRILSDNHSDTLSEIVRESNNQANARPRRFVAHLNQLSPPVIPVPDRVSRVVDKRTELSARTLRRCRNVHHQVRAFRDNWNALRSGSLKFNRKSSEFGGTFSQKQYSSSVLLGRFGQLHSISSTSCQLSSTQAGSSSNGVHDQGSEDINRAWKMMDIAKKMQQTHERTSTAPQGSGHPSGTRGALKEVCNEGFGFHLLKTQVARSRDLNCTGLEKQYKSYHLQKDLEKHRPPKLVEKKQTKGAIKESIGQLGISSTSKLPKYVELPLSRKVQTSIQGGPCLEDGERRLGKNINETSSNMSKEHSSSASSATLVGSVSVVCSSSHQERVGASSSIKQTETFGKNSRIDKSLAEGTTKYDDAKSEIQSLVKLNLKLLSKDKQLGLETFKEVARLATHTILAACGLEHRKSNIHSFSGSVCSHTEGIQKFHKSVLMPNSCRQCFYVFVKNVVSSIMLEKLC